MNTAPPAPNRLDRPMPLLPVADFLRAVERSRLISPFKVPAGPPVDDAAMLADRFVATGALTRFQADKLLRGFWQGLRVGPYRLLCPLGRGGMGIVYLARDDRPGPHPVVALKVLPPLRAKAEPRTLTRFQREMELGLALPVHPHLTRTHDAGEANGVHYLAMEYVTGPTVRQQVNTSGPMTVGAACRVFADAAAGLAVAHTAGFVHRDLKPSNLIVAPAGRGKVLDFGIALRVGEPTPADPTILGGKGYTVGTMDYLAPEQAADASQVGPAADVYALGCSLYFSLTGTPPFPGGGPQDKIRAHRTAAPAPVTEFNFTVPAEFDRLIRWLMAKSPDARPTADKVANVLAAWADPVQTTPAGQSAPTAEQLVREAESRWQATRGKSKTREDDSRDREDDSSAGVELMDGEESSESSASFIRVPATQQTMLIIAGIGLALFFLLGVLVGLWAGR